MVDKEDTVSEQRVEESGGGGEDAVTEPLYGGPDDVAALGVGAGTV